MGKYLEYLNLWRIEASGQGEKYDRRAQAFNHFLNWSEKKHKRNKETNPQKPGESGLRKKVNTNYAPESEQPF